jgi:hypothetical protein
MEIREVTFITDGGEVFADEELYPKDELYSGDQGVYK